MASSNCSLLTPEECSATCLPIIGANGQQKNFSCGDWWHAGFCCNGSESHEIIDSVFYSCSCSMDGLSGRGYAVVTSLAFTSLIIVFVAVVYVYRVRNRKLTADQQQADRAVQEANLFLPR